MFGIIRCVILGVGLSEVMMMAATTDFDNTSSSSEAIVVEVYTQTPTGWIPFVAALDADTTLQQLSSVLQLQTGVRQWRQSTPRTPTYPHQVAVTNQDLRGPIVAPSHYGLTMLPLTGLLNTTLRQLRPMLVSCGSITGSVPMLLHRLSTALPDADDSAEALECAQLLATLAGTAAGPDAEHGSEPTEATVPKGPRTERRAIKRPLPLPMHMRDETQAQAGVAAPINSAGSCDSDSDDVVWAPNHSERPTRRRRHPPAYLSAAHRGKRSETGKRWTLEETDAFIAGVEQHGVGNWQKVHETCGALFGRRTTVDLKDKWRNLVKAVSTPGLIPRSVRLTPEQKERIQICIATKVQGSRAAA